MDIGLYKKLPNTSLGGKLSTPYRELLKEGVIAGFGWAIGVTFGFIFITTLLAFVLNKIGGLPIIGVAIGNVVKVTLDHLNVSLPTEL